MISYYDSLRKTIRWYKKVGLHIIDIMMHNAYALNVAHGTEDHVTLLNYREHVVTWLFRIEHDMEKEVTNRNEIHNLMPHPPTEKKKNQQSHVLTAPSRKKEERHVIIVSSAKKHQHFVLGNALKSITQSNI